MAGKGSAKGEHRGGRKKGTPNKFTQDMREIIEQAFHKAGGVDYLVKQSKEEPVAFMSLIGKVIPNEIKIDPTSKIVIEIVRFGETK